MLKCAKQFMNSPSAFIITIAISHSSMPADGQAIRNWIPKQWQTEWSGKTYRRTAKPLWKSQFFPDGMTQSASPLSIIQIELLLLFFVASKPNVNEPFFFIKTFSIYLFAFHLFSCLFAWTIPHRLSVSLCRSSSVFNKFASPSNFV